MIVVSGQLSVVKDYINSQFSIKSMIKKSLSLVASALLGISLFCQAALAGGYSVACTDGERTLDFAFYAFFAPVSYSADSDPASIGFNTHLGYEADLLIALEALEGAGLSFSRHPVAAWDKVWLKSADRQYDIAGGGITILDSRTRDASGERKVAFTSGHIAFRQSLLVHAKDAQRFARHDHLNDAMRIGVLAGTTGEDRLLQLIGLTDVHGVLTAGTRIDTLRGTVSADGSADYRITAVAESPNLVGRQHIYPPVKTMPQIIYLGAETGEEELLDALDVGRIDAVARGGVGNRDYAHASGGVFVVAALDPKIELGGFTLAIEDATLLSCVDEKINLLTDNRHIGYAEWRKDPQVFSRRAKMWNAQH